ncbi:hypothetical protein [Undibacterium sp. Di24W]|uniref:hypothetical protein n=1 Tax=Undibacterium sp. Di24W TaxID=3413033 RepID=UPI003BEFD9C8
MLVSREDLFALVWSEPAQTIARRFKVSGSYLARVCERLKVPTPARGYWAKYSAGKVMAKPMLPAPRPGDEISWNPGGGPGEIFSEAENQSSNEIEKTPKTLTKKAKDSTHSLLINVKDLYLIGRLSYQKEFLKPNKRLLPDIQVSTSGLDKCFELANLLFNSLEEKGARVGLEPVGFHSMRPVLDVRDVPDKRPLNDNFWAPARNTVFYFNELRVGITIFELTESIPMVYIDGKYVREADYISSPKSKRQHSWVSNHDIPCGCFGVQLYASHYDQHWVKVWKEQRSGEFVKRIKSLTTDFLSNYEDIAKVIALGKARFEAERVRYEEMHRLMAIQREQERYAKSVHESREVLINLRNKFEENNRWNAFFAHVIELEKGLSPDCMNKLNDQIAEMKKLVSSNISIEDILHWNPPK